MPAIPVTFVYATGLRRPMFRNVRLQGSWDAAGRPSPAWSEVPMAEGRGEDGCPTFTATVGLDAAAADVAFAWTVRLDAPGAVDVCGVATEVADANGTDRVRTFRLRPAGAAPQVETYWLTQGRRLGANKVVPPGGGAPGIRFATWAPYARSVDVVFGHPEHGYIADDGDGIDPARPVLPMRRADDGTWATDVLPDFAAYRDAPYLFRVVNAQGRVVFRTDLFARRQAGRGTVDPGGAHWDGPAAALDGTKSCSVVTDLDTVAEELPGPGGTPARRVGEAAFWAGEHTPGLPVPSRVEDLVIYELHVGALGFGRDGPGDLRDAIALVPHLADLGVNAVELLPMAEFSGVGWGYGDSHHFVIESMAGDRDAYRHFVRACHQRGIAVIQDVVYNHFDHDALRSQWAWDSDAPDENAWYWYEGRPRDYASPDGGYLDNGSSGWSPRFWEETVRACFASSAAALLEELHVDGLRVDLTQAMHRDNARHADGAPVGSANAFGAKTLREWSRTLRLVKPSAMLIAEDHTGWDAVTRVPEAGGLGFDATWDAAFCHELVGDSDMAGGHARLLHEAGLGGDGALAMGRFAGALAASRLDRVVYHESHDEAGNARGSARTVVVAVNGAPLVGETRRYAEARARVAFGLSLFSAGTPMFLMGEEIAAARPYRYDSFLANREDLAGARDGQGARMFRFYREAIRCSRRHPAARVRAIDVIHADDGARVIAFRRSAGLDELLVVASLANAPHDGYVLASQPWRLPDGAWRELFNSDAVAYGGTGDGNAGADLPASGGTLRLRIPAIAILVFGRV